MESRIDRSILMPKSKKPVTIEERPFGDLKTAATVNKDSYKPREIPGGLIHSELTKYQNVSSNLQNKGYVEYTQEQIDLVNRLKDMQANQCSVSKAKTRDSSAKRLQRKLHQDAVRNKKLYK